METPNHRIPESFSYQPFRQAMPNNSFLPFTSSWPEASDHLQQSLISLVAVDTPVTMNFSFNIVDPVFGSMHTPTIGNDKVVHDGRPLNYRRSQSSKHIEESVRHLMNPSFNSVATGSKLNPNAPEFHPREHSAKNSLSSASSPSVSQVMTEQMGFSSAPCASTVAPTSHLKEKDKEKASSGISAGRRSPTDGNICDKPSDRVSSGNIPAHCHPTPCGGIAGMFGNGKTDASWKKCSNPILAEILGVESDSESEGEEGNLDDDDDWDCVDEYDPPSRLVPETSDSRLHESPDEKEILQPECSSTGRMAITSVEELTPETPSRSHQKKRVRFEEGPSLEKVHRILAWDFAYRKSRVGPWVTMSVDRSRFMDRVRNVEPQISAVLNPSHRHKIFESRFSE